jgi:hypothetical protein
MPIRNLRIQLLIMLLAGTVALSLPLSGQTRRLRDTNANGWYMLFGDHRLSSHWGAHTELQWRRHNIITDPQQLLVRVGANYHASDRTLLTLGYGFIDSYSNGDFFPEQRIYEQLQLRGELGRVALTHRYRLEQRWVQLAGSSNYTYMNRIRYMLRGTLPLKGPSLDPNEPYVSAYNEIFLGFGNNVPNIFDQNRLYAALGYRFSRQASVETGYMYQIVQQRNGTVFQHNHTLQVGFTYNFDFR